MECWSLQLLETKRRHLFPSSSPNTVAFHSILEVACSIPIHFTILCAPHFSLTVPSQCYVPLSPGPPFLAHSYEDFLQSFPSINVFCFVLPPHYVSSPHLKLLFHIHFQSRLSPSFLLFSTTLVLSASTGSSDLLPPFILSLLSFYLSFITSLFTTAVLSERLT